MNKDSYIFECLCRGISDETWNKFNQFEKDSYVKNHPHCRFAADPEKTLPTQISTKEPNKELLYKYAKIYNKGDDRAFIEKPRSSWKPNSKIIKEKTMFDFMLHNNYDVMELEDGRLASVEKPRISTEFCAGYGFCGISTEEQEEGAEERMRLLHQKEGFIKKNLEQNFGKEDRDIKKLENFLKNKDDYEENKYNYDEGVYPPLVAAHYCMDYAKDLVSVDLFNLRDISEMSERRSFMAPETARKNPQEFVDYVNAQNREKREYTLLSKKDAKKYLEMLKSCKADYMRRLENYWKKYQDKHLHTWTFLSD